MSNLIKSLGKSVELTREEIERLDEGERCASGLRCVGLTMDNYPAFVGWYLDVDDNGHDRGRWPLGSWRFEGDPLGGIYCEDCVLEIEADERKLLEGWGEPK